jgi:hypothetical protein
MAPGNVSLQEAETNLRQLEQLQQEIDYVNNPDAYCSSNLSRLFIPVISDHAS